MYSLLSTLTFWIAYYCLKYLSIIQHTCYYSTHLLLFNACAFVRSVHKVFETATFCRPRCCIISKVLADWTWSFRFLFIALSGLLIVIYIPFWLAMTPSTTFFSVKVKKFTYTKFKSFKLHVSLFTSKYND